MAPLIIIDMIQLKFYVGSRSEYINITNVIIAYKETRYTEAS